MKAGRLALATLVFVVACHRPRTPPGEVRLHLEAEPAHLNPLLGGDHLAMRVTLGDVYEPLWELDEAGRPRPVLAREWSAADDGREWTFTLREGVVWHDARPMSSDDVAFTFGLLAPGGLATPLASDFDDLTEVSALDGLTVHLRFGESRPGREAAIARVPILPRHVFGGAARTLAEHPASRAPIGTGPFRFVAWQRGREIRLERFERYWRRTHEDGGGAAVERVVYRIVPDRAQAIAQLRAGALDLLSHVPTADAEALARGGPFRSIAYDAPTFTAVTWNCRRGALGDPRVRRALTMLLDREAVVREIFRGKARVQSGPWPPGDPASDPEVMPWPFDPGRARALLDEARATGLRVTLSYPQGSTAVERVATLWREDARAAGVTIVLEPVPFDALLARGAAGDFDALVLSWAGVPGQDFFANFHSTQTPASERGGAGGQNWGGFSDGIVDALLEALRRTRDAPRRIELMRRLHRRLHELEPITIVMGDVRTAIVSRRLRGVRLGPHDIGAAVRLMSIVE